MERSEGESGESTWRQVGINRQETLHSRDGRSDGSIASQSAGPVASDRL